MSDSGRLAVIWSPEARSELRAIDSEHALEVLHCIARFLSSRHGDVKRLKPPRTGLRLRCGEYRVFFESTNDAIHITGVRHRRDAYR